MGRQVVRFGDAMGMKVAFSNAVAVNISETKKMIWISGQIALDENGNIVGEGDMGVQTEQCIKNIKKYIEEVGGSLDDIVEVTVFVKTMEGLEDIHRVRLEYFNEPYPTSTLVQITDFVMPEALIEIEATAVVNIG